MGSTSTTIPDYAKKFELRNYILVINELVVVAAFDPNAWATLKKTPIFNSDFYSPQ